MDYLFNVSAEMKRGEKSQRVNADRFFHVMNEGWFIYLRQKNESLKDTQQKKGVAGPFETRHLADTFLQRVVSTGQPINEDDSESPMDDSGEGWRY